MSEYDKIPQIDLTKEKDIQILTTAVSPHRGRNVDDIEFTAMFKSGSKCVGILTMTKPQLESLVEEAFRMVGAHVLFEERETSRKKGGDS